MKYSNYKLNRLITLPNQWLARVTTKLLFVTATTVLATSAIAGAPSSDAETAYVDSIHQWGAWELDIEPAAGGLPQPTTQALNARSTKVALRTNSIAALSPAAPGIPGPSGTPALPVIPTPPAIPTLPPVVPTITPIHPSVPIPVGTGGSNDGL